MTGKDRPEIRTWLEQRGYNETEIATILQRLDQFDARVNRESLFDAMVTGDLNLDSIVRDVLKDAQQGK